ncbi:hypothetical protein MGG_17162 [Pyricularia oryzae 70-15]|uniref:Uncharacterized protein n=1 Tax=Pyricularia oryzae (strain 70-15 / ATCC MYA-4617 / FGSC 8958) TaxID=242507 RepID=G4N6B3_PYRO7|nr:uncharacterized protein MGG_17162 [Pyricularia oryzae 70-15]EHA50635.1 hypothetical protein MGG_17162 [Pyricularia oryzae 70-15]
MALAMNSIGVMLSFDDQLSSAKPIFGTTTALHTVLGRRRLPAPGSSETTADTITDSDGVYGLARRVLFLWYEAIGPEMRGNESKVAPIKTHVQPRPPPFARDLEVVSPAPSYSHVNAQVPPRHVYSSYRESASKSLLGVHEAAANYSARVDKRRPVPLGMRPVVFDAVFLLPSILIGSAIVGGVIYRGRSNISWEE